MTDTKIKLRGFLPDWIDPTEAKIINRLITVVTKAGYTIAVRDEDYSQAVRPTKDRSLIQKATAQTSITYFVICDQLPSGSPGQVGRVILAHGNHNDVISDYSWHSKVPELAPLLDAWVNHANAI